LLYGIAYLANKPLANNEDGNQNENSMMTEEDKSLICDDG
jgi:hypothetical protein